MVELKTIVRDWLKADKELREHFVLERKKLRTPPMPILCKCTKKKAGEILIRRIPGFVSKDSVTLYFFGFEASKPEYKLAAGDPYFFECLRTQLILWHNLNVHPAKCVIEAENG